LTIPI